MKMNQRVSVEEAKFALVMNDLNAIRSAQVGKEEPIMTVYDMDTFYDLFQSFVDERIDAYFKKNEKDGIIAQRIERKTVVRETVTVTNVEVKKEVVSEPAPDTSHFYLPSGRLRWKTKEYKPSDVAFHVLDKAVRAGINIKDESAVRGFYSTWSTAIKVYQVGTHDEVVAAYIASK